MLPSHSGFLRDCHALFAFRVPRFTPCFTRLWSGDVPPRHQGISGEAPGAVRPVTELYGIGPTPFLCAIGYNQLHEKTRVMQEHARVTPRERLVHTVQPESNATEQWRPVVGYEEIYEVSDLGRVRRVARHPDAKPGAYLRVRTRRNRERTGRIIKPSTVPGGYSNLTLSWRNNRVTWLVHILVARAFLGPNPPGKDQVHHVNEDLSD